MRFAVTDVAAAGVQVPGDGGSVWNTFHFVNVGAKTAYMRQSPTADRLAGVPAPGTPAAGVAILANEVVIYGCSPGAFFSFVCAPGESTTIDVTPGEGM